MNEEMKRLYVEEKYTLRRIAKIFGTNHHLVKRRLLEMGVQITMKGRVREPFSEEHRRKLSENAKLRVHPKGRKASLIAKYKNMLVHIRWDIDLDFLLQFQDIEKLKCLNKIISRDRVSEHFNTEKYIKFVEKFYYDEGFNAQFARFCETGNRYDRPSLDHIIPLSRGGTWELENLQIISWFDNRAKCDMTWDEYREMAKTYWGGL